MRVFISSIVAIAVALAAVHSWTAVRSNSQELLAQEGLRQEKENREEIEEKERRESELRDEEQGEEAEEIERREKEEREELHGDRDEEGRDDEGEEAHRRLHPSPTIQLTFGLGKSSDEPPLVVLCALDDYSTHRMIDEPNGKHALHISGTLRRADAENGVLLTYKAEREGADYNDDFEASFSVHGSAVVRLGKSYLLGYLGDQAIRVTVSLAEAEAKDAGEEAEADAEAKIRDIEIKRLTNSLKLAKQRADEQAALAENRLQEALQAKQAALQAKEKASKQRAIAEEQRKIAEALRDEALRQREIAEQALRKESEARRQAEAALKKAQELLKQAKEKQK